MCGVFGFLQIDRSQTAEWWKERLSQVNAIQRHRGPDEQRFWISPDLRYGCAHQRLSILDVSPAGSQPMQSHSGRSLLVFNGEIYNHRFLKSRISETVWRGHSDTEVLLENLEIHGDRLLKDLDGMFAFGFFDINKKSLLLATDPAGEKPLYTYWDGKIFAFSSEIKAFKAFPEIDLSLSKDCLKEYLVYGYVPFPRTAFKNIQKLPAGSFQWIDFRKGPDAPKSYWDLPLNSKPQKVSYREAQVHLRSLLTTAIEKRLVADVPVGSFLSGGLDSSAVSLLASEFVKPQKLKTFSVSFNVAGVPADYDESVYAKKIASQIQSDHYEILIDPNKIEGRDIPGLFDDPFADSSAIPTYYLCQETSRQVKVVLSGDGGDELFGGYRRFQAGLLSDRYSWVLKPLLSLIRFKAPRPRSWQGLVTRFKRKLDLSPLQQQLAWNSFFEEGDFEKFLGEKGEDIFLRVRDFEKKTEGLSIIQKILYYNFKTYLFDDLLPKVDRMSMAHGLEVRTPYLDKALIEFAFTLPDHFKVTPFETKKILKDSFEKDLGYDFVHRKKQGFALPIENFLAKENFQSLPGIHKIWPKFQWTSSDIREMERDHNYYKIYLLMSLEKSLGQFS